MTASPTRRQLVFLLGSLLLAPLVTLYATQAVWLQSLWAPLPWMASHGGATVLFWVLFSSLSLTLYGFFRRLFPAYLPEVAVFMGVAVTSRYKLDINGAPLQLSDFAFVGNLGDITGYAASQLIPTLTTLLAIGVAAVLTETLRRKETWRPSLTQGFVLGSLCLTLFLSALYPGALQSAALRLDQNSPDQETRNERMGVVLGLYTAWAQRLQVETGTADPETTRLVDQLRADAMGPGTPAPAAAPDIIFVTSESFFDVTRLPGLTFSQDPLPNFHRLSETCTNGPFLSNTYGGGTGHVEMEMFTGLTSSLLKEGDTLNTLHTAVYQDLPTTVRLLQKAGYATTALHAHTSELYNRETIYPAIGFDTVAFLDDFLTPVEIAGKYASDDSFARELIARYEARDPSQPVFLYGMSMENHQTYTPENDVIQCAARQDYDAFYESEIRMRRLRRYPPFADLFTVTVSGTEEGRVLRAAVSVRETLRQLCRRPELAAGEPEVLGPAPAPVVKVNNRFRYRCTLVGKNDKATREMLAWLQKDFAKDSANRGMNLFVDHNAAD